MGRSIQINYEYLRDYMLNERHLSFSTGLAGVHEILSAVLYLYVNKIWQLKLDFHMTTCRN